MIVFPALALLFRLTLAGRFRATEVRARTDAEGRSTPTDVGMLTRVAVAYLVAGIGLLNIADAAWAHALGVGCLIGFAVAASGAILIPAPDEQTTARV